MQFSAWIETKRVADQDRSQKRREAAIAAYQEAIAAKKSNSFRQRVDWTERQVYTVPAMMRALTELPADRRAEFVSHLTAIVDTSFRMNDDLASQAVDPDQAFIDQRAANPLPILSAACGACQGECCRNGGTHAFISVKLIDGIRRVIRGISPSELIDLFLSYLPSHSYDESCVYHQDAGCALPRTVRNDLCNEFECEELHCIRTQSGASPVVLVSLEGNNSVRIVEFDYFVDE